MGFLSEMHYPSKEMQFADSDGDWTLQLMADELVSILVDFSFCLLIVLLPHALLLHRLRPLKNPPPSPWPQGPEPPQHSANGAPRSEHESLSTTQGMKDNARPPPVSVPVSPASKVTKATDKFASARKLAALLQEHAPILLWPNLEVCIVAIYAPGIFKACASVLSSAADGALDAASGLVNLAMWALLFLLFFLALESWRLYTFFKRHAGTVYKYSHQLQAEDPMLRALAAVKLCPYPAVRMRGSYALSVERAYHEPESTLEPLPQGLPWKVFMRETAIDWLQSRRHAQSSLASLAGSWLVRTSGEGLLGGIGYQFVRLLYQIAIGVASGVIWYAPDTSGHVVSLIVLQLGLALYCLCAARAGDRLDNLCGGLEALVSSVGAGLRYYTSIPMLCDVVMLAALSIPVVYVVYDLAVGRRLMDGLQLSSQSGDDAGPGAAEGSSPGSWRGMVTRKTPTRKQLRMEKKARSSARVAAVDGALAEARASSRGADGDCARAGSEADTTPRRSCSWRDDLGRIAAEAPTLSSTTCSAVAAPADTAAGGAARARSFLKPLPQPPPPLRATSRVSSSCRALPPLPLSPADGAHTPSTAPTADTLTSEHGSKVQALLERAHTAKLPQVDQLAAETALKESSGHLGKALNLLKYKRPSEETRTGGNSPPPPSRMSPTQSLHSAARSPTPLRPRQAPSLPNEQVAAAASARAEIAAQRNRPIQRGCTRGTNSVPSPGGNDGKPDMADPRTWD
jgi:hypothetical protein